MRPLFVAVLLASCAANLPPPPIVMPEPPTLPLIAPPTPATKAITAYRAAEAKEGHAVTKPQATTASINEIARADRLARQALRYLVSQDGHPTVSAIAAARKALDDLIRALEATPQQ